MPSPHKMQGVSSMKSQQGCVRRAKLARLGISIALGLALTSATAMAADATANLGEGLKQLVAPPVAARAVRAQCRGQRRLRGDLDLTGAIRRREPRTGPHFPRRLADLGVDTRLAAADRRRRSGRVGPVLRSGPRRSVRPHRAVSQRCAHQGCTRGRALEPDGHQRRRHRQPGRRPAPRGQAAPGRRWLGDHGWRDVRQL